MPECSSCSVDPMVLETQVNDYDPETTWQDEKDRGMLSTVTQLIVGPRRVAVVHAKLKWCPVDGCDMKLTVWVTDSTLPGIENEIDMKGGTVSDPRNNTVTAVVDHYTSSAIMKGGILIYGSATDRSPIPDPPAAQPVFDSNAAPGSAQNPDVTNPVAPVRFSDNGRWFCLQWKIDPNDEASGKLTLTQGVQKASVDDRQCSAPSGN